MISPLHTHTYTQTHHQHHHHYRFSLLISNTSHDRVPHPVSFPTILFTNSPALPGVRQHTGLLSRLPPWTSHHLPEIIDDGLGPPFQTDWTHTDDRCPPGHLYTLPLNSKPPPLPGSLLCRQFLTAGPIIFNIFHYPHLEKNYLVDPFFFLLEWATV